MATHSSILAWRIPGMGEPGGLPSTGLQSWTQLKRLSSSRGSLASIPPSLLYSSFNNAGLGGYPVEGNGYQLQYSCLVNSMDRGVWQAIVHRVTKSRLENSVDGVAWLATVHGVAKSRTWLSDWTELNWRRFIISGSLSCWIIWNNSYLCIWR